MKKLIIIIATGLVAISATAQQQLPMKLWYKTPATYFEESMPIGNGRLGALVYGGTNDNIIYLNDITLWTGKPVDRDMDKEAHEWIPKIREALFNEDYKTADDLQHHVQGPNSQYYQPLATMHITDDASGEVSGYYRELNLDSAICRDRYTKGDVTFTREYFASNPDKLIAIRIKADKPGAINCKIMITAQIPHMVKAGNAQLTMTGHAIGDENNSIHYCSILKIKNKDGNVNAADSTLYLNGVSEATVYFVNETSFNGFDKNPVTEGAPYIEKATDDIWHTANYSYEQMRGRHIADYQQYFNRLKMSLDGSKVDNTRTTEQQLKDYTDQGGGNPYLETLYMQFGRYLLISSSRTTGVPANLQGLWNHHKQAPWRGNYTVNINLEENYWPAEEANLSAMMMPLNEYTKALSENGRYTAKNYYGIDKGWCSSHNSDIWAMTNPVGEKRESPEWSNWNMGGAWLSQALWEHFDFTRDVNYLRNTAYPLLKGASDFMMEWLIDNPKHPGELITAPSTSPENEYKTDKGYHGTTCYGGTADLAIIRELLSNTQKAASTLNVDKDYQAKLRATLNKLHPYTIGHMGDINEWYYDWDDWDFQHRHQSHLIGLYPGHQITIGQTPELAKAAAKSLEIKGDKTTGWSTGWRINLWARLHDAKQAYHIYQKLLTYVTPDNYKGNDRRHSGGTYPNLFDAHPPFQIDGNFGGTAGVCEMLVQSGDNRIELLPALPEAWKSGSISGICARGGYEVDMVWKEGKVTKATISSKVGGTVSVCYNGKTKTLKTKAGQKQTIK